MRTKIIIVFSLLFSTIAFSQELKYENHIYDPEIKTVLLSKNIDVYDPVPVMPLGSLNSLKLIFDKLNAQNEFYNYTFVHCDASWNPSDMQSAEYLMGNPNASINKYTYSTNTYEQYVHYSLTFPKEELKITRSGNYLLKVYVNFDETQVVLTRRFMVVDLQTSISAKINSATSPKYRNTHQEVDFMVDYTGFTIPNPFTDVNVTIMQNNSWESAIYGLKPRFVNNNKLDFNYEEGNLFPGTHEYRFFDIRSLRFFSNRVANKFQDSLTNVVLMPDESRSHQAYVKWVDYNGKRVISNKDGVNIVEDGDYAMVHFFLKTGDKSELGDVYIYGELSDWQTKDEFKMAYDAERGMYYAMVKLKQSYYNYLYVLKDKKGELDFSFTEGNHFETENDYTILVYHKNVFYGYDELIGVATQNSAVEN